MNLTQCLSQIMAEPTSQVRAEDDESSSGGPLGACGGSGASSRVGGRPDNAGSSHEANNQTAMAMSPNGSCNSDQYELYESPGNSSLTFRFGSAKLCADHSLCFHQGRALLLQLLVLQQWSCFSLA